ncbi:hypothetical protein [Actinoallomurus soli]|uniref:hypothetical protein n=1 Tax=Actinoallomurus soli TaxID=2952535 RepID=UPI002092CB6C|nr:hypothetical protein [Actinoallomurus soli]MCO5974786.1 hypothetical protein [Actinoallomurus soli]
MTADATRYRLLTALAWHLAALKRTSLIVVPSHGEPVLYLPRRDGTKLGIAAGQRDDGVWDFLWGRTGRAGAEPVIAAAYLIAKAAA